jgi:DnaK suppressor protein
MNRNGLRNLLLSRKEEIQRMLRCSQLEILRSREGFRMRSHNADQEDTPEVFSVNVVRVRHLEEYLTNIDESLRRLNHRKFGYCTDCGIKIPSERLKAMPFATRCIDCQTEAEKSPP